MKPVDQFAFTLLPMDDGGFVIFASIVSNEQGESVVQQPEINSFASLLMGSQPKPISVRYYARDARHAGEIITDLIAKYSISKVG
jgi:hypothetical protein